MEVDEFQRVLNLGLGRAILHLQKHPASRSLYRDVILYACLNNIAYDPQTEGDRTEYLVESIRLSDEAEFYREQILHEFAHLRPSDDWTTEQFFYLAFRFAQQGHEYARQLLYQKYKEGWDTTHLRGSRPLVSLDGFKGFLFAVDPLKRRKYPEKHAWIFDYLLSDLEKMVDVDEVLATEYSDNPQLRRFILAIRKSLKYRDKYQKAAQKKKARIAEMSYKEIKQRDILKMSKKKLHFGWWDWGNTATEEDLTLAAEDFLREDNSDRLLLFMDMFRHRRFPLDLTKLLQFGEYGDERVARDQIAMRALNVLENVSHDEVRKLALRMIEQGNRTWRAVGLLNNNFEEGDWKFIEEVTARKRDAENYHGIGLSVENIFKAHPSDEVVGALLNLYEYGPCSRCRERFVDLLHQLNKIPDWMAEECQYDSNPHLRAKARQGFASVEEQN
jgi:hypothetical protein